MKELDSTHNFRKKNELFFFQIIQNILKFDHLQFYIEKNLHDFDSIKYEKFSIFIQVMKVKIIAMQVRMIAMALPTMEFRAMTHHHQHDNILLSHNHPL